MSEKVTVVLTVTETVYHSKEVTLTKDELRDLLNEECEAIQADRIGSFMNSGTAVDGDWEDGEVETPEGRILW